MECVWDSYSALNTMLQYSATPRRACCESQSYMCVHTRARMLTYMHVHAPAQVWDVRNHKCIETVTDEEWYKHDNTLHAMLFDTSRKQLVTGNLSPKVSKAPAQSVRSAMLYVLCNALCTVQCCLMQ